jgi:hypothetical protein
VAGSCENGNEISGSIKCREFLEWLRNWWLLHRKGLSPMELLNIFLMFLSISSFLLSTVAQLRCICGSLSVVAPSDDVADPPVN